MQKHSARKVKQSGGIFECTIWTLNFRKRAGEEHRVRYICPSHTNKTRIAFNKRVSFLLSTNRVYSMQEGSGNELAFWDK
jgi:hypothetical protein